MSRPAPHTRKDYAYFHQIPTRWADNDVYGHVNNSVYYFYFDTVVNKWLIDNGLLEIGVSPEIGLVVETGCQFLSPITFPDTVNAGLRVGHIGNSSVRYEIGLFRNNENKAAAQGHFVHVYVGAESRRPAALSQPARDALARLM